MKMNPKTKTLVTIGVIAAAVIGWDVWLFLEPPEENTVSEVLLTFSQDHPVVVLIAGILAGHIFWPQFTERKSDQKKDESKEGGGE